MKILYVTCASRDEALKIAKTVVDERLAACGNILDGMTSVYRWQDQIQEEREVVLILKTTATQVVACSLRVRELHSYEVPCVVSWDSHVLNPDYKRWLDDNTNPM